MATITQGIITGMWWLAVSLLAVYVIFIYSEFKGD